MAIGVLFDVMSIQDYVFSSNKLKDNLGASYIVANVFELFDQIKEKTKTNYKKGFIGGGNALIFFDDTDNADVFIKEFTKTCLVKYPSLKIAVATAELESNINDMKDKIFINDYKKLFKNLDVNKKIGNPNTKYFTHGFMATDIYNNEPLSLLNPDKLSNKEDIDEPNYVSVVTASKREAAKNMLKQSLFQNLGYNKFPTELEELINKKGEDSYIAVVHIDGNGVGNRFKNLNTLEEIQNLSISLDTAIKNSFNEICKLIQNKKEFSGDSKVLPIRPIIIGGDDITFVTRGELGIYLAKNFIDSYVKQPSSDNVKNSACAGVAIVNVKYPFYRAYKLSEELCNNAKQKRKEQKSEYSFIDFHIQMGQLSGSINSIREKQFVNNERVELILRPLTFQKGVYNSLSEIIKGASYFATSKFPKTKFKELREVLYGPVSEHKKYINQLDFRGISLSSNKLWGQDLSFSESGVRKTPYIDIMELSDFYPDFELQCEVKNAKN